jgi:hypothetical protein
MSVNCTGRPERRANLGAWLAEKMEQHPTHPPILQKRGQKVLKTKGSAVQKSNKKRQRGQKTLMINEICHDTRVTWAYVRVNRAAIPEPWKLKCPTVGRGAMMRGDNHDMFYYIDI